MPVLSGGIKTGPKLGLGIIRMDMVREGMELLKAR